MPFCTPFHELVSAPNYEEIFFSPGIGAGADSGLDGQPGSSSGDVTENVGGGEDSGSPKKRVDYMKSKLSCLYSLVLE